jgi:hypothetical protein
MTGNDRYRDVAARLYATGSFWRSMVSMAAADKSANRRFDMDP